MRRSKPRCRAEIAGCWARKATLAVVAALAFGAGALAPSAASRVSQMKMFQTYQGTKVAEDSQAMSTTGVGGDEVGYNAGVPMQTNAGTTGPGGETVGNSK